MRNDLRVAGLVILAALTTWLFARGCTPAPPPLEAPPEAPQREAFHAAKPLLLDWRAVAGGKRQETPWAELELRRLLARGKMNVAPLGAPPDLKAHSDPFQLHIEWRQSEQRAALSLLAPDGALERRLDFELDDPSRLALMRALAARLPEFLDAPLAVGDWTALLGVEDANSYEVFTTNAELILGPEGSGFTRPPVLDSKARAVEQLESLVRRQPQFARARALLAAAYLSVGGEDMDSLTRLARSTAERALVGDAELALGHAALGLAALRSGEWGSAHERFASALRIDPNVAPALEGMACLLADVGRLQEAHGYARRAVTLQPGSLGANECLAYAYASRADAKADSSADAGAPEPRGGAAARVLAAKAMLDKDLARAERLLQESMRSSEFRSWAQPLLKAAAARRRIPEALRAVTGAVNESIIDPHTEILCGVALGQPEFVFNRMRRLQARREHAPLRPLWLPQAAFLREHPGFREVVSAAGLPAFWQQHGAPDVCESEPRIYGCAAPE